MISIYDSDFITFFFYNLISFVHGTVYKNDPPERILAHEASLYAWSWLSSRHASWDSRYIFDIDQNGNVYGWTADIKVVAQRPVLFLYNS